MAKQRPASRSAEASTTGETPEVGLAGPTAALVEAVRVCYERELRLRRVAPMAKSATDAALVEAVRAGIPYQRLARIVVPPTERADDIAGVRAQRRRVAVRFRKRVARVTARHRSLPAEATRTLPNVAHEPNDTNMQDPRRPLYIRETFYDETILPPDVARPTHPDEDDDDEEAAELEGPDLDDDGYEDDDMDDDE